MEFRGRGSICEYREVEEEVEEDHLTTQSRFEIRCGSSP